MTAGGVVLAVGGVVLAAIHAFLFWGARGRGKDPAYNHPGEPSPLPGGERPWALAFGLVTASAMAALPLLAAIAGFDIERAVFWTLAVIVGGQLALFCVLFVWATARLRSGGTAR